MATVGQAMVGTAGVMAQVQNSFEATLNAQINMTKYQSVINNHLNIMNNHFTQNNIIIQQTVEQVKEVDKAVQDAADSVSKMPILMGLFQKGLDMGKSAASKMVKEVFSIQGALDQMDVELPFLKNIENMSGSSATAQAALFQLKDAVADTGYSMQAATEATQAFARRGMNLGGAVDQVKIWGDAVAYYGNGSDKQFNSVLGTLDKMCSSAKIETSQLDTLFDAGIDAVKIYGESVGKSSSQVKKELEAGKISSLTFLDTVSNVLSQGPAAGAAKNMELTWKQTFDNLKGSIASGWASVMQSIDQALGNAGLPSLKAMVTSVGGVIQSIFNSIKSLAPLITAILTPFIQAGKLIRDNWSLIAPILAGVIGILGVYLLVTEGVALAQTIGSVISSAFAAAQTFLSIGFGVLSGSTAAASAAVFTFNSALMASPITWIIILIIAIVAAIYFAVAAFNKLAGTSVSATGLIMAAFAIARSFMFNTFFVPVQNAFAALVNFIGNVFNDPVSAVKILFYDLVSSVLGYILKIAEGIEALLSKIGVKIDITSKIENIKNKIEADAANLKDESGWKEYVKKMDYKDYVEEAGGAYKKGKNAEDTAKEKLESLKGGGFLDIFHDPSEEMVNAAQNTANNTGSMANSMEISGEDLKYMRDIADREAINRFTTAELSVNMQTSATVNGSLDIDGIISQLEEKTHEMLVVAAEGV